MDKASKDHYVVDEFGYVVADDHKTHPAWQIAIALLYALVLLPIIAVALCATSGCVYKGGKVTEGTDLSIGVNIPVSEGTLQFQALNYLSGFRVGVDQNAITRIHYTNVESNSYLGVVQTRVRKDADVEIVPLGTNATATATATATAVETATK